MLNKLRSRAQEEKGFTLIELLVVILIIGILAAIALPAFLGQRGRAQDTEAKSAVREAQTAMETYYTDNQQYTSTVQDLKDIEASLGTGAGSTLAVTVATSTGAPGPDSYTLETTSKTTNKFKIAKSAQGDVTRTCTKNNDKGSCRSTGGSW